MIHSSSEKAAAVHASACSSAAKLAAHHAAEAAALAEVALDRVSRLPEREQVMVESTPSQPEQCPFRSDCAAVYQASAAAKYAADAASSAANAALASAFQDKSISESASRFKSEFIANISHEIRTPLAIIQGYAELLATDTASSESQSWVQSILRSSQQLEMLISDILDISKIEAGKISIERASVSLAVMIADIKDLLALKVAEKGIQLSFTAEGPFPAVICTDPLRLKQVLLNVIGNAIKFTHQGRVDVTVKMLATAPTALAFVVQDTGIGISPNQQAKIFEAFNQADSSISRRFGGTGLGLSLSLGLAHLLGGDIVLNSSELGRGSCFTVSIDPGPLTGVIMLQDPRDLEFRLGSLQLARDGGDSFKDLRVLLVEDAEDLRALVTHILLSRGMFVTQAANGAEGVQSVRDSSFDLILMDIQMPILNGYEATRLLRAEGCRLPIFALTAHAMSGEREHCLAAGFTDYLTKPIHVAQLFQLVRTHVKVLNKSGCRGANKNPSAPLMELRD